MARMCQSLWVEPGKVSDGLVSVDTTCIGMSDQGPALLVNNLTVPVLTKRGSIASASRFAARCRLPTGRKLFRSRTRFVGATGCWRATCSRGGAAPSRRCQASLGTASRSSRRCARPVCADAAARAT